MPKGEPKKKQEESTISLISRFLSGTGEFTNSEALKVIFFVRILIGLLIGVALGSFKIKGMIGFVAFFGVVLFGVSQYASTLIKITDPDPNNPLLMAHFLPALCAFLLSWTLTYDLMTL